jgi:hypothetical protein
MNASCLMGDLGKVKFQGGSLNVLWAIPYARLIGNPSIFAA